MLHVVALRSKTFTASVSIAAATGSYCARCVVSDTQLCTHFMLVAVHEHHHCVSTCLTHSLHFLLVDTDHVTDTLQQRSSSQREETSSAQWHEHYY
jgi:hypothetical protein